MESISTANFINIRGELLDLSAPKVMGIVNLTADSFYDGGKIKSDADLLSKVNRMAIEGVDILDVGAYSSRPGATDIPLEVELKNALYGIREIKRELPDAVVSIDTFRSKVAEACLGEGADIVNDISGGGLDDEMFDFIEKVNVPYILMHMRGNPKTMTQLTTYDNLITDIIDYFNAKVVELNTRGVKDVVLDPGFGFAKTKEQSFTLLNGLKALSMLGRPLLCGVSRKSMIFKSLSITADEALNGTTALNMACLMNGASILRVHDVKEAKETIALYQELINN